MQVRYHSIVVPGSHRANFGGHKALGEDRVGIRELDGATAFLLADGATGIGFGAGAAEALVEAFDACHEDLLRSSDGCGIVLEAGDIAAYKRTRGQGDTTGIIFSWGDGRYWGSSAGDSQAYLYRSGTRREITAGQRRKPRIGSGCFPIPFSGDLQEGDTIIAASDGLWDFVSTTSINEAISSSRYPKEICSRLLDLVRASNLDRLPDDLSIALTVAI